MAPPIGNGTQPVGMDITMDDLRAMFGASAVIQEVQSPLDLLRAANPKKNNETLQEYENRILEIKAQRDAIFQKSLAKQADKAQAKGKKFDPLDLKSSIKASLRVERKITYICALPGCNKVNDQNTTLKKCSRCKQAMYCGKEHQKSDWARHKLQCKKIAHLVPTSEDSKAKPEK